MNQSTDEHKRDGRRCDSCPGFVPVDVEDPDEGVLLDVGDQSLVHVLHDPVEEFGVDMFGQRVAGVGGLQTGDGLDIRLGSRLQLPVAQPLGHVLVGDPHQVTEGCEVGIVGLEDKVEMSFNSISDVKKLLYNNILS